MKIYLFHLHLLDKLMSMKTFSLLISFMILVGFYPRPQPLGKICLTAEEKYYTTSSWIIGNPRN